MLQERQNMQNIQKHKSAVLVPKAASQRRPRVQVELKAPAGPEGRKLSCT